METALIDWLKARQTEMGLGERAFAAHLGIDPATWWRLKTGKMQPTLRLLSLALARWQGKRDELLSLVQPLHIDNNDLAGVA